MFETDETLYRRYLTEHKEEDFRILLERHRESLTLFLCSYVRSLEDAEELMLDAYAAAAAGPTVFSGRSSFKTWLFSIGKKLALMHLRKARTSVPLPPAETDGETAELALLRDERDRTLYRALDRLNGDYRQILILLYFERMSHEEAGRVMRKTRKQIYNLAERGRKALKEELEGMGFEYARYG